MLANLLPTLPLAKAFAFYLAALDEPFNGFQIPEMWAFLHERQAVWCRARGGSKTRDACVVMVFLRLYFPLKDQMWISAARSQCNQLQRYLRRNPFVSPFTRSIQRHDVRLVNGLDFNFAILNDELRGIRARIICKDEVAQMKRELLEDSEGISTVGASDDPAYELAISTPIINTKFHEMAMQSPHLHIHPFKDCSWLDAVKIEASRATMSDAKWRQENLAEFTAMGGAVFEHILRDHCAHALLSPSYGCDPNPKNGYWVAGVTSDQKECELVFIKNFGSGNAGKEAFIEACKALDIEIELNGVGQPVFDDYAAAGGKGYGVTWTDANKSVRANALNKKIIHIPETLTGCTKSEVDAVFQQLSALHWNEDGSKIDKPHGQPWDAADAFLHAVHESGSWHFRSG